MKLFQRQLYESATRDGLTKLYNKKFFSEQLRAEFSYAVRHQTPLTLVMIDIDFFKKDQRYPRPPGGRLRR